MGKHFLIFLLLLLTIVVSCNKDYISYNNKGVNAYENGKLQDAINYYDKALEGSPNSIIVLLNKAKTLYQIGNYLDAMTLFNEIIEKEPTHKESLYYKGVILNILGNSKESSVYLKHSLTNNTKEIHRRIALAYSLMDSKEYQETINVCNEILKSDPENEEALHIKGIAYFLDGNHIMAKRTLTSGLEMHPNSAKLHHSIGLIYYRLGDISSAIGRYEKATENLDNTHKNIFNDVGIAYYSINNIEKAMEYFDKAIETNTNKYSAYINKITLLYKFGMMIKALRTVKSSLRDYKEDKLLLEYYGAINKKLGNYEDAITIYDKLLEIYPDDIVLLSNKYQLLKDSGNNKKNTEILGKIINNIGDAETRKDLSK